MFISSDILFGGMAFHVLLGSREFRDCNLSSYLFLGMRPDPELEVRLYGSQLEASSKVQIAGTYSLSLMVSYRSV